MLFQDDIPYRETPGSYPAGRQVLQYGIDGLAKSDFQRGFEHAGSLSW